MASRWFSKVGAILLVCGLVSSVSCAGPGNPERVTVSVPRQESIAHRYIPVVGWDFDGAVVQGADAPWRRVFLTGEAGSGALSVYLAHANGAWVVSNFELAVYETAFRHTYRDDSRSGYMPDEAPRVYSYLTGPIRAVMANELLAPSACVRWAAAGGADVLPAVLEKTRNKDDTTRAYAFMALGDLHVSCGLTDSIRAAIVRGVQDTDHTVVVNAVAAALWYGCREATPHLLRLLDDERFVVAPSAVMAGVIVPKEATYGAPLSVLVLAALQQLTKTDLGLHSYKPGQDVRASIARAKARAAAWNRYHEATEVEK